MGRAAPAAGAALDGSIGLRGFLSVPQRPAALLR